MTLRWKDLKVATKLAVGFGAVLLLAAALGGWAIRGIGLIVKNAEEVIGGNKLRGEIVQREVDHLNWAAQVNALLTDANVSRLDVQTDSHKCGFGEWYYSQQRKEAEALIPELKELFAQIEEPHHRLHQSAEQIAQVFRKEHPGLQLTMAKRFNDHLAWVETCGRRLANEAALMASERQLRNAVDQACSVIAALDEKTNPDDVEARKRRALEVVKAMRFGPEGKDYLWINDTEPRVVLNPLNPDLEGQDLSGKVDPNGKRLFVEIVTLCREKGEGLVTYTWAKEPGGKPVPWLCYVKLYRPWNWIIGTSVAMDENDQVLLQRAAELAAGQPFRLASKRTPRSAASAASWPTRGPPRSAAISPSSRRRWTAAASHTSGCTTWRTRSRSSSTEVTLRQPFRSTTPRFRRPWPT